MLAQAYHRHSRFMAALVFGGLMWAASRALPVDPVMSGLIAINSFFLGYLALILTMILRSTPEKMRRHSEQDDEGAVLILGIALLAVGISLSAIFLVLNRATISPIETVFALSAAPLGWATLQVLAHLVLLVGVEEHHVLALEQPGIGVGRDLAQVAHLHGYAVRARHVGQQAELARGHVGRGDEQHRGRLRSPHGPYRQKGQQAQRQPAAKKGHGVHWSSLNEMGL